jgi:hypothetical protein
MQIKDLENLSVPELLKLVKKNNITLPTRIAFMNKEKIADAIIKYMNASESGEL